MHVHDCPTRIGALARRLILTTTIALTLAPAAAASAPARFQANVGAHDPLPKPCPGGDFICGSAMTNYGPATWTFHLTSLTPPSGTCDTYQATVAFELQDSSTLTRAETGTACAPGDSIVAPDNSYGHPTYATGTWTVQTATGQFHELTGATGTDTLHIAGAHSSGTYTETP
jgi:hypothetical protein